MSVNWDGWKCAGPDDVAIYGLVDPVTNAVRYVGQTTKPELRFRQHMSTNGKQCNPDKARWLQTLRCEGFGPRMDIVTVVSRKDAYAIEMLTIWIVKADLTNRVKPTPKQMERIAKYVFTHEKWGPMFRDAGVI